MKIRSLTIGLPIGSQSPSSIEFTASRLLNCSRDVFKAAGLMPRTVRYTCPAVGDDGETEGAIQSLLIWLDRLAESTGIRWYCLPLDFVASVERSVRLAAVSNILDRYPRLFINMIVSDGCRFSVAAINDVASTVLGVSRKSRNGFDNFRVGASSGCGAGTPFFPFSRHSGDQVAISLALEVIELAMQVARRPECKADICLFRDSLVEAMSPELEKMETLGRDLAKRSGVKFVGLDASYAPFPGSDASVGLLVETLIGSPVGSHGSVFITALLTDALRTAFAKSGATPIGFNGVMYSLLEDDNLAASNNRRHITLDCLTALSGVCGCGIDMVPIPGSSFAEEIAALMLDIVGLSLALSKPLGIRLLPIPGRGANEFTNFNLDFLCDSRVVELRPVDKTFRLYNSTMSLLSPLRLPKLEAKQ